MNQSSLNFSDDELVSTPVAQPVANPTLYILDSFSLIYQVFHAIDDMTGPAGQPTNAVFGIVRDLMNLKRDRKPDYLVAAFDGQGPVFRSDILPEYKAQRAGMPDDLRPQIDVIRRVFEAFRVPVLMLEGMEADDVIATVARKAAARGLDVVVCTGDKDARQLITDQIRILNLRKQQFMDAAALKADWGIRPDQVVDYLSLTGDTSDNVPGIPGIGPKTASELIQKFETLENLLANVDKVAGPKRKDNLINFADVARKAQSLITLRDDVELDFDWEAFKSTTPDVAKARVLCVECGFHGFLAQFGPAPKVESKSEWVADYQCVDTPEKFGRFLADLKSQPRFCIDTETTSVNPLAAEIVGLSFCWEATKGYYLPLRGPAGSALLDEAQTLEALKPILADPAVEKVGQNAKYDMLVLERSGLTFNGPITDTMVLSYLLESGERNHSLDQLSERLLDHAMVPISDLIGKGKNQLRMDQVDTAKVCYYAAEDADATWRIETLLSKRVRDEGLWPLYADLESPLIRVLAGMERHGIKVDVERLKQLSREFGGRLTTIETELYQLAGRKFNIGSLPQLRKILFEDLKLPISKRTPGGEPSTDVEVLEELAIVHPLPRLLIEHRQLAKLKSTYLDALSTMADATGRIHASFNQVVAATGRLSSSDPNLQNIPIRTEMGGQIRQAFVAGFPDWVLLTADYSQIELRILAHYSKDPALVHAFENDHDIHTAVASRIFKVPESEVTKHQRGVAKTVNFGVIYGMNAYGLAIRLGISQTEASAFIDAYFQGYAGVDAFITKTLESAVEAGRVETILGRRRPIQGIKNTTGRSRNSAERTAVNTVIQGSAADLIKGAMLRVDQAISDSKLQARMLLQIHDELVFECPRSEVSALSGLVREAMIHALDLDVPLRVDLGFGPNWLDVESLET